MRDRIMVARVLNNQELCREHYRLTVCIPAVEPPRPGQFVHLCPPTDHPVSYRTWNEVDWMTGDTSYQVIQQPMLRRAFSVAGFRSVQDGAEMDVIYRVVGRCTRWLESLSAGD